MPPESSGTHTHPTHDIQTPGPLQLVTGSMEVPIPANVLEALAKLREELQRELNGFAKRRSRLERELEELGKKTKAGQLRLEMVVATEMQLLAQGLGNQGGPGVSTQVRGSVKLRA
jgi:hypothetical protein